MTNDIAIRYCDEYLARNIADIDKEFLKKAKEALQQEPCGDAISRDKAIVQLSHNKTGDDDCDVIIQKDIETIKALPPVTPQQKTGRWISFGAKGEIDGQIVRTFTCSECGAISIFRVTNGNIVNGDLCPNCGAKMVELQESEEA